MAIPLPVGVLVGFLGGGKTTLLRHLLEGQAGRRIAVVVNDFAELNIDARLVRRADARLIELSNGCICCTLRDDLLRELRELAALPDLDYVLIEATGLAEPLPIAQTFYMADLPALVRLDAIITVVDGAAFWRDFARTDRIEDTEGNPVEAPLAPLLVEQIEFSNIVVLNKAEVAAPGALDELEGFVRKLNPEAQLHRASFGRLDPALLLDTGRYDYTLGAGREDWEAEWSEKGGEAEEYGFGSFVYRRAAPLDRDRFLALFDDWPDEIVRAKGFVNFAEPPLTIVSVVRDTVDLAELPPAELGDSEDLGGTELVFIGRGMRPEAIARRLDACLARG